MLRWRFLHYPPAIAITIADMLEDPELGLTLRSRGRASLDVAVRWVYVTDLPDPSPYLNPGDLVATNGLWRRRRSDSERFVARLVEGRACGLVYGLKQRTMNTPKDLIEACERHGLLLMELPHPHAFSQLAKAVADEQAAARRRELDQALSRQDALVQALSRGAGPRGVLEVLMQQNRLRAVMVDPLGRAVHYRAAQGDDLASAGAVLATPHPPTPEPRTVPLPDGRE